MLADVRPMRIGGRPIPRECLCTMQPIRRGELSVTRRRDPWRDAWVPIAVLRPVTPRDVPALDEVRIARWVNCGPQLQAWWVQLVIGPDLQHKPPSAPVE